MPNTPIRLIAYDLDGTMLNDAKQISPGNLAALAEAREKGCILLPATGRPLCMLYGPVIEVPGVRYVLTSNGAAIWDLGADPYRTVHCRRGDLMGKPEGELPPDARCIALAPLPAQTAITVVEALRPFLPGVLKVFVSGRMLYEPESFRWEQENGKVGFRHEPGIAAIVPNLSKALPQYDGQIEKVCMFFATDESLQAARRVLDNLPNIAVVQGAPDNLEITAPGVDKGLGLQKACAALGIDPACSLALGDSENDLGMLRDAGFAGVVANGMPQAKALADYISAADNEHDGAAEILHHYL